MAVRGEHVVARHLAPDVLDQCTEVPRDPVTDGVGDVEGRRAGLDARVQDLEHEVERRPRGVLRAELDVGGVLARPAHAASGLGQHLLARHLEHVLHVLGLVEMKTWMRALAESRSASQHLSTSDTLVRDSPAMTGADGPLPTDRAIACTASKSPWLATGKPGLDVVHTEARQLLGDLELLAGVEGDPR